MDPVFLLLHHNSGLSLVKGLLLKLIELFVCFSDFSCLSADVFLLSEGFRPEYDSTWSLLLNYRLPDTNALETVFFVMTAKLFTVIPCSTSCRADKPSSVLINSMLSTTLWVPVSCVIFI